MLSIVSPGEYAGIVPGTRVNLGLKGMVVLCKWCGVPHASRVCTNECPKRCGWQGGPKAWRCDRWKVPKEESTGQPSQSFTIFPDVPLPTASPTGRMASLLERCVVPLDLWRNGNIVEVNTDMAGYTIPKIRHVTGPCWETELGQELVDFIRDLHERSAPHGWICRYWSHEAMDAEMQRCPVAHLREAYFAIDPKYYVVRSDLFRPYLLYMYGGLWLDLRGRPSVDKEMIGLDQIFRKFQGAPPPIILERCGGFHKEKFGGTFGQISNGWMASARQLLIWQLVIDKAVRMVADYHERASWTEEGQLVDATKRYFTVPVSMTGREGVLCQGPLAATPVIHEYLTERGAMDQCMPKCVQNLFCFNKLVPQNSAWWKKQGRAFYRDEKQAREHKHYSRLNTPIIFQGASVVACSH